MLVICAWCGNKKGEVEPYEDKRISHGICLSCKEKALNDFVEKKQQREGKGVIPVKP